MTSDAHAGLRDAIAANLPDATWQRCRTHCAANLMSICSKSMWPALKAMLHSVYDQPDATAVQAQFDRLLDYVTEKLPAVADHLAVARDDVLYLTTFPKDVWTQIWSNNPAEHLNKESGAAPTQSASSPTATPSSASSAPSWPNKTDEWAEGRRYVGLDVLTRSRLTSHTTTNPRSIPTTSQHSPPKLQSQDHTALHHVQGLDPQPTPAVPDRPRNL